MMRGLGRTKSEQLVEPSNESVMDSGGSGGGGGSRKSSRRMSPGGKSNSHIRKSRSAQIKVVDLDDVGSGAALSRASSASLGLSFSFTGFTLTPDYDSSDSKPFRDQDIRKFNSFQL